MAKVITKELMMSFIGSEQDPIEYLLEIANGEYTAEQFNKDILNHSDGLEE